MYYYVNKLISLFVFLIVSGRVLPSKVLRPRGVSLAAASLYDPGRNFYCFDGSGTFAFKFVNDDYCDCLDGSDEPGTAACINGSFHCNNVGHEPKNIYSAQVNDGFCDCCDTSDEYASGADCIDTCMSLGEVARAEAVTKAQEQMQGFNIRKQLSEEGHRIKKEKQDELAEFEKTKEAANLEQLEKAAAKELAEAPEREALEKYKELEDKLKEKREEERRADDRVTATKGFSHLDKDQDGILTLFELRTDLLFDTNKDGEVSEDEAKFYLNQEESMDLDAFLASGWSLVRPLYTRGRRVFTLPTTESPEVENEETEPPPEQESEFAEEYEEDYDPNEDSQPEDEEEEEAEEFEQEPPEGEEEKQEDDPDKIVYDDETQSLIDAATIARNEFNSADQHAKEIIRRIQGLKETLEKDFGPNEEFRPLYDTCLEYTDREYTYKLCIFDYASQAPKDGGSETRLGTWGEWSGPDGDPYSIMKYNNGVQCWNGPQRSAEVKLICGVESALLSVSEPNRCEYQFIMSTPSICNEPEDANQPYMHTEL